MLMLDHLNDAPHTTVAPDHPEEVLHGARVLVLEDELVVRDLLGRMLKLQGCHVEMMDDGHEALKAHAVDPFDLVIVDLNMPKMWGVDFLRRLAGFPEEKQPGKMVISGFADMSPDLEELGVRTILQKPFRSAELVRLSVDALAGRPI